MKKIKTRSKLYSIENGELYYDGQLVTLKRKPEDVKWKILKHLSVLTDLKDEWNGEFKVIQIVDTDSQDFYNVEVDIDKSFTWWVHNPCLPFDEEDKLIFSDDKVIIAPTYLFKVELHTVEIIKPFNLIIPIQCY